MRRKTAIAMLLMAMVSGRLSVAAEPVPTFSAVPTFECVGLYWSPAGGGEKVKATADYRAKGEAQWKKAQDLWYDGRAIGGRPAEYRGSIISLRPGTSYEVRLTMAGKAPQIQQFTTWNDKLPIAKTITVPATSDKTLVIDNVHGSADGYILYTAPEGGAKIDVNNAADANVLVTNSSFVIIRGMTLTGAKKHGIQLGGEGDPANKVSDIVVEGNDISNWGTATETGFGGNCQSAVYSSSPTLERIVVQRNRMHDPRTTANCWKEKNRTFHPEGPQGVSFMAGKGRYVIRYNEIVGNATHHFNDSMGNYRNFSYEGFPNRDSDIYGNYIAYCWDDGIESEGANMNVRVWGNYLTETYISVATATVSMGPMYLFRNVSHISRTGPNHKYGQAFLKCGGPESGKDGVFYGDGRAYIFHNTILQIAGTKDPQLKNGLGAGNRILRNYVTRNNILDSATPDSSTSISDNTDSPTNDFDFDLYVGKIKAVASSEKNGVKGAPIYTKGVGMDKETMTGNFAQEATSPGYDKGAVLANFNDDHAGKAPDMGAHEAGAPPMQFGVRAYLPAASTAAK